MSAAFDEVRKQLEWFLIHADDERTNGAKLDLVKSHLESRTYFGQLHVLVPILLVRVMSITNAK